MKSICFALFVAAANAFAPSTSGSQRAGSVSLNAEEFSKSIPFLVRPDKLDGTLPGDMGFDPMRLSDIQTDLNYARWAEVKHGRICMLAICGILAQQAGWHFPGAQFTNTDIFGAPGTVGFAGNLQVFLAIGSIELLHFNKHYEDGIPGDIGFTGMLQGMNEEELAYRLEQEIVHGRLAMIGFVGAIIQTLLFKEPLLAPYTS